jgi:hypothetical protein
VADSLSHLLNRPTHQVFVRKVTPQMMQRQNNQREKRHAINSVAPVVIVFPLCGGAYIQDQIVGLLRG